MHYKIICRTDVKSKSEVSPLYLQFYHEGRRKKVTTGVAVNSRFWDDSTQQLTSDCPNRDELQVRLNEQIRAYEKKILEKPCARDPRSPVPLTLAVQNSLTL